MLSYLATFQSWTAQHAWAEAALFATLALFGYLILSVVLGRLAATSQATRLGWDDVIVNAISPPVRVAYLALVVFFAWQWVPKQWLPFAQEWLAWSP